MKMKIKGTIIQTGAYTFRKTVLSDGEVTMIRWIRPMPARSPWKNWYALRVFPIQLF